MDHRQQHTNGDLRTINELCTRSILVNVRIRLEYSVDAGRLPIAIVLYMYMAQRYTFHHRYAQRPPARRLFDSPPLELLVNFVATYLGLIRRRVDYFGMREHG